MFLSQRAAKNRPPQTAGKSCNQKSFQPKAALKTLSVGSFY
ncbi:hypothetical protein CLOLEP_00357 [[Clostridium] leptum DSM 753]|uniref:Uncharacterized protein n=1 Tax=[Clostridium] leptum DSM 753 TaxID=428125 RepID=A7VP81_9FIRM|nr:hypothetical protein CLOLEP_00357 [[Clostridium] leptum DSM 753]